MTKFARPSLVVQSSTSVFYSCQCEALLSIKQKTLFISVIKLIIREIKILILIFGWNYAYKNEKKHDAQQKTTIDILKVDAKIWKMRCSRLTDWMVCIHFVLFFSFFASFLLFTSITVVAVVLCVCLCLCVPVREQTLRKDNKNILSAFLSRGAMDQSVKC